MSVCGAANCCAPSVFGLELFRLSLSLAVIGSLVALVDYRDVIMAVRESWCVNSQSVVRQSSLLL